MGAGKSTPSLFGSCGERSLCHKLKFTMQSEEILNALLIHDAQTMTPLLNAAMFDHADIVEYLVEQCKLKHSSLNKYFEEFINVVLLVFSIPEKFLVQF